MGNRQHTPNEIHIQGDTAYMVLTNQRGLPVAVTMIDPADVPVALSHPYRWRASWDKDVQNYYVVSKAFKKDGTETGIKLHRLLLNTPEELVTDHKNHNTLDNRRKNLVACTQLQNRRNVRPEAFRHVYAERVVTHCYVWWAKDKKRWKGYVLHEGERYHIGSHLDRETAEGYAVALQERLREGEGKQKKRPSSCAVQDEGRGREGRGGKGITCGETHTSRPLAGTAN